MRTPPRFGCERPDDFEIISGEKFVIATGTRPARPATVPFNNRTIFCSDALLKLEQLPKSMIIVGGGVIGTEYACMMATLGVRVTLVEGRNEVLGFLDHEIAEAFQYQMRRAGMTLRLGEKVEKIEEVPPTNGNGSLVHATLESGKVLKAQTLLYSIGRQGTTGALNLEAAGLKTDDRERLKVNGFYQTEFPAFMPSETWLVFPLSRAPQWNRAGWRSAMPSARPPAACRNFSAGDLCSA